MKEKLDNLIDELVNQYEMKVENVDEISEKMKSLGLEFFAQDWQIKGIFEQFLKDLNEIRDIIIRL